MTARFPLTGLRPAVILALTTAVAYAALPPGAYRDMLAAADVHVQLEITATALVARAGTNSDGHGLCTIEGEVVQTFRGAVEVGDPIALTTPCAHADARDIPVGGSVYSSVGELDAARYVEVVLDMASNGTYTVAGQGFGITIIDLPTPDPAM